MKRIQAIRIFLLVFLGAVVASSCLQAQKVHDKKELNFSGVRTIFVEGNFCDVNIEGTNRKDVEFKGEVRGWTRRGGEFKIMHEQKGEMLHLWIERPGSYSGNLEGHLDFEVPSDLSIEVRNLSGDIRVSGIRNSKIKLKASSGDIYAKNVEAGIEYRTSSGDVEIYGVIGDLKGESTSGDQILKDLDGNIYTRASSGDLRFSGVKGKIESGTSSGDVDFVNVYGVVFNESSSGDILVRDSEGSFSLRATSGNIKGEGIRLKTNSRFRTSSGDIQMRFENNQDELSFELEASSGDLYVGNRHGEKEMLIRKGDILVRGETTSGNQRYR